MSPSRDNDAPTLEQSQDTNDATLQPYQVGDPIPVRMGVREMCRAFPINGRVMDRTTFHRLERQGKFRRFELPSRIGTKHWSGTRVARYLTGDSFSIAIQRSA